jgi:protein-disulfide isomerase
MKPFYAVLAVIAVIGIGGIMYAVRGGGASGMATEPVDLGQLGDASSLLERARGVTVGEVDAPVHILVFSDYQCPGCAHFATQVEPMIKAEFVATGKVRMTFYDFPLGGNFKHSFVASRAARCADDQGRFADYHNRIMAQQQQWSYSQSTPTSYFLEVARGLGLDQQQFEGCLRSDAHAEVVTANRVLGETLGVTGTPTVFLNNRQLREWQDYGSVRAAIQEAGGV